jgi:citrate lyase gamma subunit
VRREILFFLGLAQALAACDSTSTLPLDVEVKDGTAVAGGKWDEIRLVVKSLPGAEIQFGTETKNMEATRAVEQFVVPKSTLKLGKNSFVVRAKIAALLSKREAEKKVEWDVEPKAMLRFQGSAKGDAEALSCVGAMCGQPTLKATKGGLLPLEIESAIAGTLTVGSAKVNVAPGQKAALDLDLLPFIATRNAGELAQLTVPFSFEASGAKADDAFELGGAALSDFVARTFAQVEQAPLTFSGEKAPADPKRALLLVVGAPIRKFIVVGSQAKFADVDLVGVAKKAERQVACAADSEIIYNDLEIRVIDRRTAKTVGTKKLRADRVSCPPTPSGKLTGEVREDDVKRVLAEFLGK